LAVAATGYRPAVIDLVPGHGWLDLVGIAFVIAFAFTTFFVGLAAVNARSE
jgi:hypothetical protein